MDLNMVPSFQAACGSNSNNAWLVCNQERNCYFCLKMHMSRRDIYILVESGFRSDNKFSFAYNSVMLAAVFAILIPLMFIESCTAFVWVDGICCSLFIIDYLLRWITADYKLPKYGKSAFLVYPFTFMAIIDLLSILPLLSILDSTFKVLRTARLFRVISVVKFLRYYEPLQIIIRVLKRQKEVLATVMVFAVFYIFVIALVIFNVEGINPATGELEFPTFFDALYWSACTLTTIGFGDFYPVTTIGKAICMISALVGIAIIALPSSAITSAYIHEIRTVKRKPKK